MPPASDVEGDAEIIPCTQVRRAFYYAKRRRLSYIGHAVTDNVVRTSDRQNMIRQDRWRKDNLLVRLIMLALTASAHEADGAPIFPEGKELDSG